MSRFHSYLNSSETILRHYDGSMPFAIYLKQFFAQRREMGSRDRKLISQLCYQFFRLGHFKKDLPLYQRIVLAARCSPAANAQFLEAVDPEWQEGITFTAKDKAIAAGITGGGIFPYLSHLSKDIEGNCFGWSMLHQPHLFLRIRPGCKKQVLKSLDQADIRYQLVDEDCLQLDNATNIGEVLPLNDVVVVQDRSSQQTGSILLNALSNIRSENINAWDTCAASGGKSIMLADTFEHIQLTVSDIRDSIMANLKTRFREAGLRAAASFVADLSKPVQQVPNAPFDLILADVPCSGSGTWARTPEQLFFFKESEIADYAVRQWSIASNAITHLKAGGYFIYITCSVFAAENEHITSRLVETFNLESLHDACIPGYKHGADSMYIAVLKKKH